MEWVQRLKPGVNKYWLGLLAGVTWTGVGIYLISLALGWIFTPEYGAPWKFWIPGIILALLIYQFGFSRLAIKNSLRIEDIPDEKPCLFAFQEWHSYPLILFMIGLGITLRTYTPISKPLLGILYIGIGGGLGLASSVYYINLWKHRGEYLATRI